MSAFVPGFQYDIFISYRHADNTLGWVRRLHEILHGMLKERARPGKNEPVWKFEIFRDEHEIPGHEHFPDVLREAVTSSAVLLIVMSDNYLADDSDWCAQELALFRQTPHHGGLPRHHQTGRIFVVLRTDVEPQRRPPELRALTGYQFWEVDRLTGRKTPISFDTSSSGTLPVVCDLLADDVLKTLRQLRTNPVSLTTTLETPATQPTVFLAEVTDELFHARSRFYTYLEQAGIRVIPAKTQSFRFMPEAAQKELPLLVRNATLMVQLHGKTAIPADEAFAGGLEAWLFAQAQAAGKKPGVTLLRWRRKGTKPDDLDDVAHRDFVFAGDVIEEDLEQFKQFVAQQARELLQREAVHVAGSGAKVLIATKQDDAHKPVEEIVTDLIDVEGPTLARIPVEAAVINDGVSLQTVAKKFEQMQAPPRALLVLHADGDEDWVQQRMKECRQYRLSKKPNPPMCAVVVKPPDDQPHPMTMPGFFEVIRHDNEAKLRAFIQKIGREAAV